MRNDFIVRAETPKMMIGGFKKFPKRVVLKFKEQSGTDALISIGDAKNASVKTVEYVKQVMEETNLSPEEKSLMLKAIYR